MHVLSSICYSLHVMGVLEEWTQRERLSQNTYRVETHTIGPAQSSII